METFGAVLIGVISSLLATLLFLGSAFLFRKHLAPWIEDKLYRGIRIDGHWRDVECEPNGERMATLDLVQRADTVTGFYTHNSKEPGSKTTYRVQGEIQNGYFNASFWPVSPKMLDSFTYLGRLYHNDSKLRMKGMAAFMDSTSGDVESHAFEFVHDDS